MRGDAEPSRPQAGLEAHSRSVVELVSYHLVTKAADVTAGQRQQSRSHRHSHSRSNCLRYRDSLLPNQISIPIRSVSQRRHQSVRVRRSSNSSAAVRLGQYGRTPCYPSTKYGNPNRPSRVSKPKIMFRGVGPCRPFRTDLDSSHCHWFRMVSNVVSCE